MLRRRRQPAKPEGRAPRGLVLGRRLAGEAALPMVEGKFIWPLANIPRHALILGASGCGKTETAMRIAEQISSRSDAQVFYLDAKGDRGTAERFTSIMANSARAPRVFPNEPFDAWRGDWRAISNRLLEVVPFTSSGPAAFYRDIAKRTLQLACSHPDGPPRSSAELIGRLDYVALMDAHGATGALSSLSEHAIDQVRMRYQAYFGQVGSIMDGKWSWEDVDSGYLLLDSAALAEDATATACLLFADFAHYFSQRKSKDRLCLLIVDEFSAIADSGDVARRVEQARSFNTGLVLVPQSPSGIGSTEQRDRLLASIETLIVHSLNEPEEVAPLAGTRQTMEPTHNFDASGPLGRGSFQLVRRARLEPDEVRRLRGGEAWVIRRGRAGKIAVCQAQLGLRPLPQSVPSEEMSAPISPDAPKEIAYLDEHPGLRPVPQSVPTDELSAPISAEAPKEIPYVDEHLDWRPFPDALPTEEMSRPSSPEAPNETAYLAEPNPG